MNTPKIIHMYTKEELISAVRESDSVMGVLRTLGIKQGGTGHRHISQKIREYGIDRSHFKDPIQHMHEGSARAAEKAAEWRKAHPEEILIVVTNNRRTPAVRLRSALIDSGIPYKCVMCGNTGTYNGAEITLEVDHINQDWRDNRVHNLQFLCPNCHSQKTHEGQSKSCGCRNKQCRGSIRRRLKRLFKRHGVKLDEVSSRLLLQTLSESWLTELDKTLHNLERLLMHDAHKLDVSTGEALPTRIARVSHPTKIDWPDNLSDLVWTKSLVELGKELGVSDTAIETMQKREHPVTAVWILGKAQCWTYTRRQSHIKKEGKAASKKSEP